MTFKCKHCDRNDFKSQGGLTQHLATEPCRSRAIAALGLANDQQNPNAKSQGRITRQASALQNRAQTASRPSRVTQYVAQHDPGVQAEPKAPGRITRSMQSLEYRRGEDDLDGDDSEISGREDQETTNEEDPNSDGSASKNVTDFEHPFGPDDIDDSSDGFIDTGDGDSTDMGAAEQPDLSSDFQAYCNEGVRANLTAAEVSGVRLMDALRRNRAPLKAYKDISEWKLKETGVILDHQVANDAGTHYVSRETLIKRLTKRYGLEHMFPKEMRVTLPSCKETVRIPYHEAEHCIERLLTDPRITDDHYKFFDNNPKASPPKSKDDYIADLMTGDAFYDTYHKLINEDLDEHLMGCLFYIDAAATGQFADLPVTILKMSLSCFTREACLKDYCWVPMGYVPHVKIADARATKIFAQSKHMEAWDAEDAEDASDSLSEEEEEEEQEEVENPSPIDAETPADEDAVFEIKAQDFHTMIEAILQSYIKLQQTGFYFEQAYKRRKYEMHYQIFCPMVKCDTEEGDTLCGKYLSRTQNVKHLCRTCHIPMAVGDRILKSHPYKTQKQIQKLVQAEDQVRLQAISQHLLRNAWYKVRFNMGNERGIHGACPSEMLHAIQLGVFKYVRDIFFTILGKTSKLAIEMNALGKAFGRLLAHQSDRSFGSTNFTKGIMEGKLMAKDYRGVLLNIAACIQSQAGQVLLKTRKKFRKPGVIQDWLLLVETLLEWEAYLNEPKMARKHLQRLRKKHKVLMYLIKAVAPRVEGMGLKIMKFHAILHMVDDILLYGIPLEFDTAANESHHKPSKAAAKLTQRNLANFDIQVAIRLFEFMLIDLALLEVEDGPCRWEYYDGIVPWEMDLEPNAESPESEVAEVETSTGSTQIAVSWDEDSNTSTFEMLSRSKNAGKTRMCVHAIQFLWELKDLLAREYPTASMKIFTEHRRDKQIFHGHPNYRGGGPWRDWVVVNWGGGWGKLPCHIACFVVLDGITNPRHTVEHGGVQLRSGTYGVVESTTYEEGDLEVSNDLFKPVRKDVNPDKHRVYYLADVSAFEAPCCCIPDLGGPSNRYFHVQSRSKWAHFFTDWIQSPHKHDDFHESEDAEPPPRAATKKRSNRGKQTAAPSKKASRPGKK